jgi:Zn-dependent protease with chaperone function
MRIRTFNSKGKTHRISVISDNFLLASILVLPLLTSATNVIAKLIYALLVFLVAGTFVLTLSFIIQRVQQWRIGARSMPKELGQEIVEQVGEIGQRLGLENVSVYWVPSNFTVSARVFGIFKKRIVITGGLTVLAKRSPLRFASIIAHELAHLRNGDTVVYFLIALLATTYFTNLFTGGFLIVPSAVFGIIWFILLVIYLLRRRELIADSLAMNALPDRAVYLSVLLSPTAFHGIQFFHPAQTSRCKALLYSCPVLRISFWVLLIAIFSQVAFLLNVDPIHAEETNFFIALPFAGLIIISELWKGPRRKIAAGFGEEGKPITRTGWRGYCAAELNASAERLENLGDKLGATSLRSSSAELLLSGGRARFDFKKMRSAVIRNARYGRMICLIAIAVLLTADLLGLMSRGPRPVKQIELNGFIHDLAVLDDSSVVFVNVGHPYLELSGESTPRPILTDQWVDHLSVRPYSTQIAALYESQIHLVDLLTRAEDRELSGGPSKINGVFSRTGQLYAKVDNYSRVTVFRLGHRDAMFSHQFDKDIVAIAFSADDTHVAVASQVLANEYQEVHFFGSDGKEDRSPLKLYDECEDIFLDEHANVFSCHLENEANYGPRWKLSIGKKDWVSERLAATTLNVSSQSGRLLAKHVEYDDRIQIVSSDSNRPTKEIQLSGRFPWSIKFGPNDDLVAAVVNDRGQLDRQHYTLQVWTTAGSLCSCMWTDEPTPDGTDIQFSPNGDYLGVESTVVPSNDGYSADRSYIRLYKSSAWRKSRPWSKSPCDWMWKAFALWWKGLSSPR